MKIGMRSLRFFILLFAASSLLFQFPPDSFAATPSDISATDSMDDTGSLELNGASDVDTFTIGSSTYAIVAGNVDDGVQIIDISDPTDITATDRMENVVGDSPNLDGARGVDVFTIGSSTYAIVTSFNYDGVQIIDISDPTNIVAKDTVRDTATGRVTEFDELNGATDVETFTIGSSTYAIVASQDDDGVQIIDISDVDNIVAKDSMDDTGSLELDAARGVDVFTIGSSTYAIVAAWKDDGVQIIDISDPTNIVAKDSMDDTDSLELDGANDVETFTIGSSTYAIVASNADDGVQIIDISDPTNIVAKDSMDDTDSLELDGANDVETFTIGSSTYAIVASNADDGVQIIDISDPTNIVAKDSMDDTGSLEFDGARGIDVFTIDSSTSTTTYAIVTSYADDGVQIIDISDVDNIVAKDSMDDTGSLELNAARGVETFIINSVVYAIVTGHDDDGVQMFDLGNCASSDCVYTEAAAASVSGSTSSTCARLVILGNCGTIAINNDEYRIIHPWSTIPTTEVMVGEPVSITLSTPHNYAAGKINSVSVYTEIFGSAANYEQGAHIGYSIMNDKYSVSKAKLFQVTAATHRIVQDPDVKNLEMFEVVFTMVFAKPMDTSYIVVETKNRYGIPETIYLGNALKVIERPIELLTYEEKSKFKIISEPELKVSLRHGMDPEPDMDMLVVDPEPVVSKVTCGNGTMLKANMCVVDEMSFYFFVNQFMRFFG